MSDDSTGGIGRSEGGIAPNCTFCDSVAKHALHVLDGTDSRRYQVPVCDGHWRDYLGVVNS